jgi:hypothetical protein
MINWKSSVADVDTSLVAGATPSFQWSLRSSYANHGFEYDATVLKAAALLTPVVPAYTRVDARVSRQLKGGLQLALAGQNLFQAHHLESAATDLVAISQVSRTMTLRASWRFGKSRGRFPADVRRGRPPDQPPPRLGAEGGTTRRRWQSSTGGHRWRGTASAIGASRPPPSFPASHKSLSLPLLWSRATQEAAIYNQGFRLLGRYHPQAYRPPGIRRAEASR